ncbi:hypothetical protein [Nonomuraea sp. NPDC005650]|uniref:hypothetical protein n=1 Tax=Nonomuraea sp. NPDC005650 TaxID=3157045 RepID=UPI0033B6C521
MLGTLWPWPDIITTIARRSLIRALAVRVALKLAALFHRDKGRTDTFGGEPRPPLETRESSQPDGSPSEINYRVNMVASSERCKRLDEVGAVGGS